MLSPTLRIAALLAFGALLALCDAPRAALAAALAFAVNLWPDAARRARALALLHRSRWLLLTVALLDAFATPGAPAWPMGPAWLPSAAGLELASHRVAVLVAMLAAVNLLLSTTSTAELVDGITRLARPARAFGIEPQRLGARLAGALEQLGAAETHLRQAARAEGWAAALGRGVVAVEARAAAGR